MVLPCGGISPQVAADAFVAPNATLVGNAKIGARSSIWFGTVVRGDVHHIRIGRETNAQDAAVLHVTGGNHPPSIGDRVSIDRTAGDHLALATECGEAQP